MKEEFEFRIVYQFAHLLFEPNEGKDLGQISKSIKVVRLTKENPKFKQMPLISKYVKETYNKSFYFGWAIIRKYSKKELEAATLFKIGIKTIFEPTGEECGTLYDETVACGICGANRKQASTLILKKGTIPKKDIALTIGGEIIVSQKFVDSVKRRNLKGLMFNPVNFKSSISDYYQLSASSKVELSDNTIAGVNIFDLSESSISEIYKCPKGHTIGLNLLSETYVENTPLINENDFFESKQKIGVRRGLLRPEPIYFCSQAFKKMVDEEKLSGFVFEVTHIE